MSDFSLAIGGRPIENYKLQQVKSGISQEEAQQTLEAEKDGQDTIGLEIDGVDYLISGQGLNAKVGEEVVLEGEAVGEVAFVEQEANTFAEGFSNRLNMSSGLSAVGSTLPAMAAGVRAMNTETHDEVLKKLAEGPPLTQESVREAVEAMMNFFGFDDD